MHIPCGSAHAFGSAVGLRDFIVRTTPSQGKAWTSGSSLAAMTDICRKCWSDRSWKKGAGKASSAAASFKGMSMCNSLCLCMVTGQDSCQESVKVACLPSTREYLGYAMDREGR